MKIAWTKVQINRLHRQQMTKDAINAVQQKAPQRKYHNYFKLEMFVSLLEMSTFEIECRFESSVEDSFFHARITKPEANFCSDWLYRSLAEGLVTRFQQAGMGDLGLFQKRIIPSNQEIYAESAFLKAQNSNTHTNSQ